MRFLTPAAMAEHHKREVNASKNTGWQNWGSYLANTSIVQSDNN